MMKMAKIIRKFEVTVITQENAEVIHNGSKL